jgi:hypothetical protein
VLSVVPSVSAWLSGPRSMGFRPLTPTPPLHHFDVPTKDTVSSVFNSANSMQRGRKTKRATGHGEPITGSQYVERQHSSDQKN